MNATIAAVCPSCGNALPEQLFHRDASDGRGRKSRCPTCINTPQKRRYHNDPEYRAHKIAKVRARRRRERAKERPMATLDFAEFITDLDHGRVNQQLGDELQHIAEEVERTGQSGELTIRLKVKREGTMCAITIDSKNKVPKDPMHGSLFYFGSDGQLHREDPRQMRLRNLKDQPVRDLGDNGGSDE